MQFWLQGSPLWNSSRPLPATEMPEKLVVPEAEWSRAISELCGLNHIEEAVVLSTCNRMEIYVIGISHHRCVKEVTEWMSKLFGVALLEVITGRPTIDDSHKSAVMWAKPLLLSKNNAELVGLSLDDNYDWDELNCMVMVASLCIHQSLTDRPQMSQVCPFQLIVKHVSALLDDRDPIKLEAESKLTDLIRSFSSLNDMAWERGVQLSLNR